MEYIGMDVHKRETQVCIIDAEGAVVLERRIRTERSRLGEVLGARERRRVLMEASTESEWVAMALETLGHEVIVADPNYTPMYATRTRRVKTDRRDARALAEANRLGAFRPAHRLAAGRRALRATLAVREALVRTRTRSRSLLRSLLRREGMPLATGSAATFARRLDAIDLPVALAPHRAPLRALLEPLNAAIAVADATITQALAHEPAAPRLQSVPGVGPITAAAIIATLDTPTRLATTGHVAAYLGLVPREWSSGERQQRGGITKTGNRRARALLIQAAWGVWRDRPPASAGLRQWAERLAARRGRRIAIVALARRLSGILFALWRDNTPFEAARLGQRPARPAVAA